MRIRDLEWAVLVAEVAHMTDAAAMLRTSQPTLSRAMGRVESELGVQVFARTPRGVQVTPVGRVVIEAARELSARYDRLRRDLSAEVDPEGGRVRLAFLDSIASSIVPRVLREVHAAAPRLRTVLNQEPAHRIEKDLAGGAVDLAITSPRPSGDYDWFPLQHERLVVVVPPQHRLAHRERVRLADLADDELVTTPEGFGFRSLVDGLFREAGVSLPISFESQDLATIEGLVAAGLGVAVVPEAFAGLTGSHGLRLPAQGAERTVGLAWRRQPSLAAPTRRFRDIVVERFGPDPGSVRDGGR